MPDALAALWFAGTLGAGILLCAMAWNGTFRRWPSLFALLALITAQSGWCAGASLYRASGAWYFWGYYGFALAEDLTEVWLITQMALELAGVTPKLRRNIRIAVPSLCAAALCFALHGVQFAVKSIPEAAATLDLGISLSWLAAFVFLPFVAKFFEIQWSGGVRPVAIGFLIEAMSCTFAGFFASVASNGVQIAELKSAAFLLSLSLWTFAIFPQARPAAIRRMITHARSRATHDPIGAA